MTHRWTVNHGHFGSTNETNKKTTNKSPHSWGHTLLSDPLKEVSFRANLDRAAELWKSIITFYMRSLRTGRFFRAVCSKIKPTVSTSIVCSIKGLIVTVADALSHPLTKMRASHSHFSCSPPYCLKDLVKDDFFFCMMSQVNEDVL